MSESESTSVSHLPDGGANRKIKSYIFL